MKKKRLPAGFIYRDEYRSYRYAFMYDGKRRYVSGKTIQECYSKKEDLITAIEEAKHRHIDNSELTLDQFYSGWKDEQLQTVKQSTIYSYEKPWKHLSEYFGEMRIIEISKADILSFQKWMLSKGKTETTVNNAVRLLKQLLNSAINDRIIDFNAAKTVKALKTNKQKATETNHRALTEAETKQFLSAAESCYYFHLFRFLLNTGCRIGEALALTWDDVDAEKSEISINKTVSRTGQGYQVLDTPKTACGFRTIPLTDNIKSILSCQKDQNSLLQIRSIENRIFPNSTGKTGNYNSVNVCIDNIIGNINGTMIKAQQEMQECPHLALNQFRHFSVHAFRDTFATRCIEQGMQPNTLKTILGHSSLKMTMDLYAHVLPNTKKEELEKIQIAM